MSSDMHVQNTSSLPPTRSKQTRRSAQDTNRCAETCGTSAALVPRPCIGFAVRCHLVRSC
eukprot:8366116-Prorocentrum_lima.AAC.1